MGSCGGVIVLPHTVTPLEDEGTALLATLALFGGNPELPIAQHLPDFLPTILPGTAQQSQWGLRVEKGVDDTVGQ